MKILIVDDDENALKYLNSILCSEDHKVFSAANGEIALSLARREQPDLVISDGLMPKMDGFELCRKLKADDALRHIPFIFYTATYIAKDDKELAKAVGADRYALKPLEPDQLMNVIQQVMAEAREKLVTAVHDEQNLLAILKQHLNVMSRKLQEKREQLSDHEDIVEELGEYANVFKYAQEAIVITDAAHRIIQVNPAFTTITQYSSDDVIGQTPRLLQSKHHNSAFYEEMFTSLERESKWQGEIWNRRKNGEIFPVWSTISAVKNEDGEVNNYISIFSDISDRNLEDEHLRYLAHHDVLTGLPNRLLFEERCEHSLIRAKREDHYVALMFLDLDSFKPINDEFGHLAGDELLQQFSRRIEEMVREGDTVARLGGDEFVIILDNLSQPKDAELIAQKIISSLEVAFDIQGHLLRVSSSIGISIYPQDGKDVISLLENADAAMYVAKKKRGVRYEFFRHEKES